MSLFVDSFVSDVLLRFFCVDFVDLIWVALVFLVWLVLNSYARGFLFLFIRLVHLFLEAEVMFIGVHVIRFSSRSSFTVTPSVASLRSFWLVRCVNNTNILRLIHLLRLRLSRCINLRILVLLKQLTQSVVVLLIKILAVYELLLIHLRSLRSLRWINSNSTTANMLINKTTSDFVFAF